MSDLGKIVAALAIFGLALGFGVWRFTARMDDCRSLGHGTFYCVIVWGGR